MAVYICQWVANSFKQLEKGQVNKHEENVNNNIVIVDFNAFNTSLHNTFGKMVGAKVRSQRYTRVSVSMEGR